MEQRSANVAGPSMPGCSLEEHSTNTLSLTELNGLSWCCLVSTSQQPPRTLEECPVISAFNFLRKENILVCWRRRPVPVATALSNGNPRPMITVSSNRELWVFWYNTKPAIIGQFLRLSLAEDGCWPTVTNGLEYNIRCLFFQALHNAFELLLLKQGHLRFGRWFTSLTSETISGKNQIIPKTVVAQRFAFIVAGNCVNVAIQTQIQPTLLRLSRRILLRNVAQPIILAPWGLKAVLEANQVLFDPNATDEKPSEGDSSESSTSLNLSSFAGLYTTPEKEKPDLFQKKQLKHLIEDQFQIYRSSFGFIPDLPEKEKLPKMVQISMDGVPMLYPTAFVSVVANELVQVDKDDVISPEVADEPICEVDDDDVAKIDVQQQNIGLKTARMLFEEAILPPMERGEERWNFNDWVPKTEFCVHCMNEGSEQSFENLPSVPSVNAPGSMNPSTPHECLTKLSEPPSVPPTSIESVASTSGEMRRTRLKPRYHPQVYPFPEQYEKKGKEKEIREIPRIQKIENEIEDLKKIDSCSRATWTLPSTSNEPVQCFANGEAPDQTNVYQLLPSLRTNSEWDQSQAPEVEPRPFTPITLVTPSATPLSADQLAELDEAIQDNCYEHVPGKRDQLSPQEYHLDEPRDKPLGLALSAPPIRSPEPYYCQPTEDSSILRHLIENNDDENEDYEMEEREESDYEDSEPMYDEEEDYDYDDDYEENPPIQMGAFMDLMAQVRVPQVFQMRPDVVDHDNDPQQIFDADEFPDRDNEYAEQMDSNMRQDEMSLETEAFETQIQKVPNPVLTITECEPMDLDVEPSTSGTNIDAGNSINEEPVRALANLLKGTVPDAEEKHRAVELLNKHNPFRKNRKNAEKIEDLQRSIFEQRRKRRYEPMMNEYLMDAMENQLYNAFKPVYEVFEDIYYENMFYNPPDFAYTQAPHYFKGDIFNGDSTLLPMSVFRDVYCRNQRDEIPDAPEYIQDDVDEDRGMFRNNLNPYYSQTETGTPTSRPRTSAEARKNMPNLIMPARPGFPSYQQSPQMNSIPNPNVPSPSQNNRGGPLLLTGSTGTGGSVFIADSPLGYNGLGASVPSNYGQSPSVNKSLTTPSSITNALVPNGFSASDNQYNSLFYDDAQQALNKLQKALGYVFAVLLRDSTMNLHFDIVFDSCPLCSCHESIRTAEYGTYLTIPHDAITVQHIMPKCSEGQLNNIFSGFVVKGLSTSCTCAFSAVRHRYLCEANDNLFNDDVREATGGPAMKEDGENGFTWFNPLKPSHWKVMDMIRWYSLGHDISRYLKSKTLEIDSEKSRDYRISGIDQSELDFFVSTALDAAIGQENVLRSSREKREITPLVHPWGVQEAESVNCPSPQVNIGVMISMKNLMESMARVIRSGSGIAVEGPLTWKMFHRKATKIYKATSSEVEDDSHQAEPIPKVLLGSDKDMITTLPTALWTWERSGLAPYSWQKNCLYMAVIPDQSIVSEKCKIFLEDLSMTYEKHKFGRHLVLPFYQSGNPMGIGVGPDSFLRVPFPSLNLNDPKASKNQNLNFTNRLEMYVKYYVDILEKYLHETNAVFEKTSFYEAVYRDFHGEHNSSAASSDTTPSIQTQLPNITGPNDANETFLIPPVINLSAEHSKPIDPEFAATLVVKQQSEDPLANVSVKAAVDLMALQDENSLQLPHMVVIYVINPFSFGIGNAQPDFAKIAFLTMMKSFNKILHAIDTVKRPRIQFEIIDLETIFDYTALCCNGIPDSLLAPTIESTSPSDVLREVALTVYSQPRQVTVDCVRNIVAKAMTKFGPASQITEMLLNMKTETMLFRISTSPFILAPSKMCHHEINDKGKLLIKNPEERVLFVTYCLVGDDFVIATATDDRGEMVDSVTLNITRPTVSSNQTQPPKRIVSHVGDAISRLWTFIQGRLAQESKNWRLVIGRFGKIGHGEFKAWNTILTKKNLHTYNLMLKGKEKEPMTPAPTVANLQAPHSIANNVCKTCAAAPTYAETPALIAACLVSTEAEPVLRVLVDTLSKSSKIAFNDTSITHIMVFPTSPCLMVDAGGDQGMAEDGDNDFFGGMIDNELDTGGDMDVIADLDINFDLGGETSNIANQPVAVGYMVSTAPALDVPDWFWATCPSSKNQTPVHLKSSLHISVAHIQQTDDFMSSVDTHELDSVASDVVLKYILQTYNELSWLNIDMISGQRRCCLPIHIQQLLKLYNGLTELSS